MSRPVFTDASSAILLEKAGLFTTVSKAFRIVFPVSVFNEITRPGYPGSAFFTKALENGLVDVVFGSEKNRVSGYPRKNEMDAGERDAIRLFLERKQGFILTDDGRAAAWCRDHDLPFINALLVPKILGIAGWIPREDSMDKMVLLCRMGRYSQKIKDLAFSFTKKDLTLFMPEKKSCFSCRAGASVSD
jgi:predicted nucleic acid-binding protein